MGFRFRKSFGKGPFRMTVSKSGVSFSAGVKGARITKKANGKITSTVGIPGSGLSYTKDITGKAKTHNIKNDKRREDMYNFNSNCRTYKDPQTEGVRTKPPFIEYIKVFFITLFTFFILGMTSVAIGNIGVIAALASLIIVPVVMGSKWRKTFLMLKAPVSYQEYKDTLYDFSIQNLLSASLTDGQKIAYLSILDFCDSNVEKEFTPTEINTTLENPISKYMFTTLCDMGYLYKPEKGHYALTPERAESILEQLERISNEKRERYNRFVKNCETYNENAIEYNYNLIKKRQ